MSMQKTWAKILGVVLLLVGILGFVMESPLLGMFHVNTLHSVVHLATGAIFAWAGFSKGAPARKVNQWMGIVYLLVAVLGFLGLLEILNVGAGMGDYDNWLHIVLGVVTVAIGFGSK